MEDKEQITTQEELTAEAPQEEVQAEEAIVEEAPVQEEAPKKAKKKGRGFRVCCITGCSVVGGIVVLIGLAIGIFAILNSVTAKALHEQAADIEKVTYTHTQLVPQLDEDGYYYFQTDGDLNVLQITDVHIGAGVLSQQKDVWAMNAVATMVREKQPDLVVITGDIAFPVPYSSGTFNNLNAAKVFATEMESLGVYWTFAFGNHDTEAYSYTSRKEISDWYAAQHFQHCLFRGNNPYEGEAAEDFGYGNDIIKVKNSLGIVTKAIVLFDSHSYTDGDILGALWKYDNIHQSQIDWYSAEMAKLRAANGGLAIENYAFFHIPLREYREAWGELVEFNNDLGVEGNMNDSEHVDYIYGVNGEITGASANPIASNAEETYGVFCGIKDEALAGKLWQAAKENNMKATFCGHDHINNFSVNYTKDGYTMRLTYGMSIDYLAYSGIYQQHSQRGCTAITLNALGGCEIKPLNYYKDFNVAAEAGDLEDVK